MEGGKALVRQITILAEGGNRAAVTGVNGSNIIVVNPPPGLLDGSIVKTVAATAGGSAAADGK